MLHSLLILYSVLYTFYTDRRLRGRVTTMYRKKFATLEDAEVHYGLTLSDGLAELVIDRRQANSRYVKAKPKRSSQATATPPPPSPPPTPTPTSNTQPLNQLKMHLKSLQLFWTMIN